MGNALSTLRAAYNGWAHGKGGQRPPAMFAGLELFKACVGELTFLDYNGGSRQLPSRVYFKSTTLTLDETMPGWSVRFGESTTP